jgi:hypothetical protein
MIEKYLASDDAGKREMGIMYGEKVLKKLIEAYEREKKNETLDYKYIRANTVNPLPFLSPN